MIVPASRLQQLPPYVFSDIAQRIQVLTAQGHDVIRLDIGSPDGPPPPAVIEALVDSVQQPGKHGYSSYTGTPAFRQAVADYYNRRFGVVLDPATQVLPLIGSKEGLVNLCLGFLNSGDLALIPDVGYPAYERGVRLAGAEIFWLPLRADHGFLPDLDSIPAEVSARARLLLVNYPNNPTGAIADKDFYQRTIDFCRAHDILLVSDNPYFDITFDGCSAGSALQVDGALQTSVEMMSFSKTYNMGGWRLGAAVGSPEALRVLLQMKSNVDTGHFIPIYDAGVAALERTPAEWAEQRNQKYRRRRDIVMAALPSIGLEAQCPQGAIYIWARVLDGDGQTFARIALELAHVSVTPGTGFGPGGTDYVRISLCTPEDKLQIAMERLQRRVLNHD
ncbi:MAG: aminotransferase class I/II-fold pyridoxal phosphate-dependent enzyme [Anaerolineae bacterium]|nr:aminotransferase class I/II-fold pyridoxal phosphate-dependent enzyme [Anaerolineae bacterium]